MRPAVAHSRRGVVALSGICPLATPLLLRRSRPAAFFARHSGESRNPAPCYFLGLEAQSFHSPAGERVTFFACAKKGNQRNTPPVARSPGILPSDFASGLRGSLNAHPCAYSELARILRATLRAFPPPARRATGGPVLGGILPQKRGARPSCSCAKFYRSERPHRRSAGMHGFVDKTGSVRGAEHRRVRRKKPVGARAGSARVGCEHRDVLSDDPAVPEKRRAVRFARCESDRRVRCLAFLVTFWAMPKSNRLAAGETKLCTSRTNRE